MCELCMSIPCKASCPNAEEEFICSECGSRIRKGHKFYEDSDVILCMNCLAEMEIERLMKTVGVSLEIA